MKLHWGFKLECKSDCIQPLPALCSGCCNYCVLMRVIIDCWSQQMKINSLCIMTSPTCSSHLCFERTVCSPFPALRLILPSTWTSFHCTRSISQHMWGVCTSVTILHRSKQTQPRRFPLNALIFSSDPKDRINASVRMWLLAWHVNRLKCFVFYRCLATICSEISSCTWGACLWDVFLSWIASQQL